MTSYPPQPVAQPGTVLPYRVGVDMQPQTMGAFVGCFWGCIGCMLLGFLCMAIGVGSESKGAVILGVLFFLPGLCLEIATVVLFMIKIYRAWKIIQPLRQLDPTEAGMPTPGQAVGFLFIPFFNLYWMFVAYRSLANRTNKYIQLTGRSGSVVALDESAAMTVCVLSLLQMVPFLNYLIMVILPFVVLAWIGKVNRTTNDLIAASV